MAVETIDARQVRHERDGKGVAPPLHTIGSIR